MTGPWPHCGGAGALGLLAANHRFLPLRYLSNNILCQYMFPNVVNTHLSLRSHLMPRGGDRRFLSSPFYSCGNGEVTVTQRGTRAGTPMANPQQSPLFGDRSPEGWVSLTRRCFSHVHMGSGQWNTVWEGGWGLFPSPPASSREGPGAPYTPGSPKGCPSGLSVSHRKEEKTFPRDCPEKCFLFPGDIFDM